jgi:hypothetical protein
MISPELNVVQDRVQGKRGEREMKRQGEGRWGGKEIRTSDFYSILLKGISYNYALRSILPRVNTSNDFTYIS